MRRAVTRRKMTSPLTLDGLERAVRLRRPRSRWCRRSILAVLTRPAPLMRTSPLMLLALRSPLMSATLMFPEIESTDSRVPAGAVTV